MELSELEHMMSAYYHEDFETLWSGLREYLADDTAEDHARLLRELQHVLATPRTEEQLSALLWELGSYAYLADEPGGYRGWLEEIARRVRAHLDA